MGWIWPQETALLAGLPRPGGGGGDTGWHPQSHRGPPILAQGRCFTARVTAPSFPVWQGLCLGATVAGVGMAGGTAASPACHFAPANVGMAAQVARQEVKEGLAKLRAGRGGQGVKSRQGLLFIDAGM